MATRITTTNDYAAGIRAAWQKSVDGIFECGDLLIAAKEDKNLKHGEFMRMVENDLPFSLSTAQRLMKIARDPRLRKAAHGQLLPPSWRTLYELSALPDEEYDALLAGGRINPDMERSDVRIIGPSYGLNAPEENTITSHINIITSEKPPTKLNPVLTHEKRSPSATLWLPDVPGKLKVAETAAATRRQAQRVIESLELIEELLADKTTANEVVELLRTGGGDLFRVTRALRALADLKTAIDSTYVQ